MILRGLLFAAAFACAAQAAAQSTQPPRKQPAKAPAQRQVDDRQFKEHIAQATQALQKGDFEGTHAAAKLAEAEGTRLFGADHPNTAAAYNLIAAAFFRQGKFSEAEANFRRMLASYEKHLGPSHEYTAAALNNLAQVLERLGDYTGAETLLRRSLAIVEAKLGKEHPDTATTLSNLSRVLDSQGKFGDTGSQRAGAKPPAAAAAGAGGDEAARLVARAEAAMRQGQFQEAETLHHQVLAIHEKALGMEHPTTATSVSSLGNVYYLQGRFPEAEKLYRRALEIREKVLGADHADVATSLNNLANAMQELGRDQQLSASELRVRQSVGGGSGAVSEIEKMYRRALSIQESKLGPDNPATANTLNNIGVLLSLRGDFAQAEAMHRGALGTMEKVFGEQHPDTASVLTSLALALDRQGKIADAEQAYLRAVEISRRTGNPRVRLINASRLGYLLARRGRYADALPYYRDAVETLDFLYSQTRGYSEETRAAFLSQFSAIYRETIRVLLFLNRANPTAGHDREALAIASRNQSRVFTEMMRQADVARFSGDPAFIKVRERREALQERVAQLRQARATIPVTLANAAQRTTELDGQLSAATKELGGLEDQLWRDYPRFMELANPRPVTVEDLQSKLLRPDEGLVSYVLLPQETVIFAVTKDRFRMFIAPAKRAAIAERIHRVRRAVEKVAIGESVLFLREIEPDILHSLYRDVFAPLTEFFAGREKILVVADGPLLTVPFEMLLTGYTQQERAAFDAARRASDGSADKPFLGEYAPLAYLGKRHRFAYLPSLSALTSQRLYPKGASGSSLELVAFADPTFTPAPGLSMPGPTQQALGMLNVGFTRGSGTEPRIPRLAETADEAKEIAAILGGANKLYIGDEAQERTAKAGELRNARFVLFATHGFLGGEFIPSDMPADAAEGEQQRRAAARSQAQPSLALTLVGDLKGEDGLLTMKEVIEDLELNAELVALSACNTAGESVQANNGEGFAGLTRAFMYAGARSLLVSHWSVDSQSTKTLMTSTFRNIKSGLPTLTAVSNAQRELISGRYQSGQYHFSRANPFFWAPFVFVGD